MTDLDKIICAIETTANSYACNGTHDSNLIADAFRMLLDNIKYQQQFGDADIENDRLAHERMEYGR